MAYKLTIRYVYSFYNSDELIECDVKDDEVLLDAPGKRFTLYTQEHSSFAVGEIKEDFKGKYVVVSYPNKENVVVHENDETELVYDELFEAMGESNHNVYEGIISFVEQ